MREDTSAAHITVSSQLTTSFFKIALNYTPACSSMPWIGTSMLPCTSRDAANIEWCGQRQGSCYVLLHFLVGVKLASRGKLLHPKIAATIFLERSPASGVGRKPRLLRSGASAIYVRIPCIYYGTEQAFAGPELDEKWTRSKNSDRDLREAMFGPDHPRKAGLERQSPDSDMRLPGFEPFGTTRYHCFDPRFHVYRRIAAMAVPGKAQPGCRRQSVLAIL